MVTRETKHGRVAEVRARRGPGREEAAHTVFVTERALRYDGCVLD